MENKFEEINKLFTLLLKDIYLSNRYVRNISEEIIQKFCPSNKISNLISKLKDENFLKIINGEKDFNKISLIVKIGILEFFTFLLKIKPEINFSTRQFNYILNFSTNILKNKQIHKKNSTDFYIKLLIVSINCITELILRKDYNFLDFNLIFTLLLDYLQNFGKITDTIKDSLKRIKDQKNMSILISIKNKILQQISIINQTNYNQTNPNSNNQQMNNNNLLQCLKILLTIFPSIFENDTETEKILINLLAQQSLKKVIETKQDLFIPMEVSNIFSNLPTPSPSSHFEKVLQYMIELDSSLKKYTGNSSFEKLDKYLNNNSQKTIEYLFKNPNQSSLFIPIIKNKKKSTKLRNILLNNFKEILFNNQINNESKIQICQILLKRNSKLFTNDNNMIKLLIESSIKNDQIVWECLMKYCTKNIQEIDFLFHLTKIFSIEEQFYNKKSNSNNNSNDNDSVDNNEQVHLNSFNNSNIIKYFLLEFVPKNYTNETKIKIFNSLLIYIKTKSIPNKNKTNTIKYLLIPLIKYELKNRKSNLFNNQNLLINLILNLYNNNLDQYIKTSKEYLNSIILFQSNSFNYSDYIQVLIFEKSLLIELLKLLLFLLKLLDFKKINNILIKLIDQIIGFSLKYLNDTNPFVRVVVYQIFLELFNTDKIKSQLILQIFKSLLKENENYCNKKFQKIFSGFLNYFDKLSKIDNNNNNNITLTWISYFIKSLKEDFFSTQKINSLL
ncbi:hypothetical protein M0812_01702 [Anaeramoeba flamelloides]|uniref:Uncharacterized protein n=1 Tax=Anaeramoeba flamelloides TaxID=1746091 RepID=A0AAV7Z0T8_9EUKA|nr:hypothetical protein M0812_01702 [Anaeramoeba flamelloides]